MNVNFPTGLGATPFIAISDSGVLSRFRLFPNQILQGLVINVSGDKVFLSLDGRMVEARTEVPLAVGDLLSLQVKDTTESQVLMRLMPQQGNTWRPITDQDLTNLLESINLPADNLNRQIVKQLMTQGVDLSRENILDVRDSLNGDQALGEDTTEAAVFLRSIGLPVNNETLGLVRGQLGEQSNQEGQLQKLEESLGNLLQLLQEVGVPDSGDASYRALLKDSLVRLQSLRLDPATDDVLNLSRELNRLIVALGDSTEGKILRSVLQGRSLGDLQKDEQVLLSKLVGEMKSRVNVALEGLRREMESIRGATERILGNGHFERLLNAATFAQEGKEGTYLFSLPITDNGHTGTLKLRVRPDAQDNRPSSGSELKVMVDMDLDLSSLGHTSISLGFVDMNMQCHFANSDSDAITLLKEASDNLKSALEERGFEVSSMTYGQTVAKVSAEALVRTKIPGTFRVDIRA